MPTVVGTVKPVALEWLGIGPERVSPGTIVAPTATLPVEKIEPDDKLTLLFDSSIRGTMATNFTATPGTESAEVGFGGPVYLDTIGHVMLNLFGDYSATGSTPTNSTTTSASAAAGATTITTAADTGMTGTGVILQIGTGATAEVVVTSAAATGSGPYTLTFANNPLRFSHASASTVAVVAAPFTHKFAILNAGNAGQPQTHTLTHYNNLTGSFLAAQYAFWCASQCVFNMDAEKLFTHETKGTAYTQQPATAAPTNTLSQVPVYPNWRFAVGIGGPASGGTLVNDVAMASVTIDREVKPYWTASGQELPYTIGRNALKVTAKFTEVAQNATAMSNYLNGTQQQVQFAATNGLSGANLLAVTLNFQNAAIETVKFNNNQVIEYESSIIGLANTTDAGGSGGQSPMSVTIQNAVPTY